jgi:hypothetical protein
MRLWDKGAHMSKPEWKAACVRIQSRLQNLDIDEAQKRLEKTMPTKREAARQ